MQPARMRRVLLAGLGALARGCAPPSTAELRLAAELLARPSRAPVTSLDDVETMDPIAGWLPAQRGSASLETRLATAALCHLADHPHDETFARVFWQYQRVRCLTHRFLVLEPGTSGLDWFSAHYQRIGTLRQSVDGAKYASALRLEGRGLHLGSLEARTSPMPQWHAVRDEIRLLARNALDHLDRRLPVGQQMPEVGLVFHFIKSRDDAAPLSSPRGAVYGCRFGRWFADRDAEARAIVRALHHNPELLLLLRGVDVASLELAVPTWAVLPLLRRARVASREAAATLSARHPAQQVHPLRVTMHAGEDFVRLVQGLRSMHEPIEFGALREADRIGHGIALGTSVDLWAASAGISVQPREERLDDLLWELDRYRLGQVTVEASRVELVRGEVHQHLRAIYGTRGRPLRVEAALVARRRRHHPRVLARLNYPRMGRPDARPRFRPGGWHDMLYRYLTDAGVHDRGMEPIEVGLHASELQFLERAQEWLAREVTRRSITIETNPSSNLLIGDMVALENHPALRFQPLAGRESATCVPVSINTDDPISFATCLVDEYAHIYFALVRARASSAEALEWLARARENGWRSRFTLAASSDREVLEGLANGRR
jgi:hypothetical protein